ncbi:MAG: helix-turn-helix domain-containing protein [Pseudomonadota bacterium]
MPPAHDERRKKMTAAAERMLHPSEIAQLMGVDRSTVYRWIRDRKLAALKVGRTIRVKKSDLEALRLDCSPGRAEQGRRS